MTVSVAVMAHPQRRHLVGRLLEHLDRPAAIAWDERNNEWDTARRAWLTCDSSASHHLVLQDDAVVCRDLCAGLEAALAHVPAEAPLSLYLGQAQPKRAEVQQIANEAGDTTSWITIDGLHWGVAVVLPTAVIPDMVAWCDRNSAKYDARVSKWLATRHLATWYPWPNLVDHLDGPSLIPGHGRRPGRRSHRFLGEDVSALDVDWSGAVMNAGTLGAVAHPSRPRSPRREPMAPVKVVTVSGDVMVATENARVNSGTGPPIRILRGRTHAHVDSRIVAQRPHMWRPVVLEFPPDDADSAPEPSVPEPGPTPDEVPPSPDDQTPTPDPDAPRPAAKDVRAWAKREKIDVPARGPLPDDVVERYQAAHPVTDW